MNIFGFAIHPFEILSTIGIFLGIRCTLSMAKQRGLSQKNMIDAILVSLITGFFGAHVVHVLFYQQDFTHPAKLLQLWGGISSTGGFLVGGLGAWVYLRKKNLPIYDYGDCLVIGVLLALFFGRLGCFSAHDHPGTLTQMPWGVMFPDGVRHDLGFEEAVWVGLFLLIIHTKSVRKQLDETKGNWMIAGIMFYGCIRAALDNMRAEDLIDSDPRYWGHTPAQYICAGFVFLATALIYKRRNKA